MIIPVFDYPNRSRPIVLNAQLVNYVHEFEVKVINFSRMN